MWQWIRARLFGVRRRVFVTVPPFLRDESRARIVEDVRKWVDGELHVVAVADGVMIHTIEVPTKVK